MNYITLIASAPMGLESVVSGELKELGFKGVTTFNGRVEFSGRLSDIPKVNISIRSSDRIYIKIGEVFAKTFDDLFEGAKKLRWSDYVTSTSKFPVSWVSAVKSTLFSKRDIQRIVKKAVVESLRKSYNTDFLPEDGRSEFRIKIQGNKDNFIFMIDTSGDGLNKRGYRESLNEAPLKETLAAALVLLSKWKPTDGPLLDPFCGSGTIAIEAAMIARNIAPGNNRSFISESWEHLISKEVWMDTRDQAYSMEDHDVSVKIYGSDIDEKILPLARESAINACVEEDILFNTASFNEVILEDNYGAIITNPPYGERLFSKKEVSDLYRSMFKHFSTTFKDWSYYIITSYEEFSKDFKLKANKNRKLYNGGLKCYFYQYFGRKPFNKRAPKDL